jgi:hypothetical protein
MKQFFISVLMVLFYPIRYIRRYERKTCFWGHKWSKWKQKDETWYRGYRDGTKNEFTKEIQYCYCDRCNKYKQEEIK